MTDKQAKYEIKAGVTGRESITGLADDLDNVSKVLGGDLSKQAQAAAARLRELAVQDAAITSFGALQAEARETARALKSAETEAANYGKQISALGPPTAQEAAALQRLQAAAEATRATLASQEQAISGAKAELQGFGIASQNAQAYQQRLRQEVASVRESVRDLAPAYQTAAAGSQSAAAAMTRTHRQIGDGVESISQQLSRLQSLFAALAGLQGAKSLAMDLATTADAARNLQSRMQLVTGEGAAFATAWSGVTAVALRTNSALEETGTLFTKLTQAGKDAGLTTSLAVDQALALTETINQTIQLSGASAQASSAAITQLVQGLQGGALRGDEFNSVMEQSPRLARALADGLAVTTGELRKMAEAGLLTSDTVIKALQGQSDAVAAEFSKLPPTVGRALQNLSTQWTLYVAETDKATGASATAATAINALASNLQTIAGLLIDAGQAVAAFAALRLAQHFLGISAATQQAAASTTAHTAATVANTAAVAANAAANTAAAASTSRFAGAFAGLGAEVRASAGAMATAQAGASRLLGVLATLRTFTLLGIITNFKDIGTWIGEATAKLVGYKDRSEEIARADRLNAEIAKEAAADRARLAASIQAAIDKQFELSKAARTSVGEFDQLTKSGTLAGDAIKKITDGFDLSKIQGIKDFSAALDKLRSDGKLSASEFEKAWAQALNGKDLAQFEITARAAFAGAAREGERVAQVMDAVLREAVKRTGLEYDQLQGKIGAASRSAINDVEVIIAGLEKLKAEGVDTGRALTASLSKAIQTADSEKALEVVRSQIEQVRKSLGDKIADGLLDQAKEKALELKDALDKATPGINSVREAMKALGITSDEELKKVATSAKEAYDTLVTSGKASARELSEGFKKAAEAAIAANNGIAPAWVTASATLRGYNIEVDTAGKSTLRLRDATNSAADAQGRANRTTRDAITELERLNAAREREIAAQEKANDLKEREIALYNKKWNMDSQHRSLDAEGKVREEVGMPTRKGVYDRAKTAGLSEEDALKFADSFDMNKLKDTGSRGTPFVNIQRLDDAINDAVLEAVRRKGTTDGQAAAPSAATRTSEAASTPAPSASPGSAGMSAGATTIYQSNITLQDGRTRSVRYPDLASQQTNEQLMRELVAGKGVLQ